jgi:DNA-binding Lrp family transcriptional regulator
VFYLFYLGITFWKSKLARKLDNGTSANRQEEETHEVKSFRDQQQKEAAFEHRDRGIRTVPLNRIVGSVGRYKDFDSRFRFKPTVPSERLKWIKNAIQEGRTLGPVKVFEIKNEFYVQDGNHRIAAAKELGHDEILAHIVDKLFELEEVKEVHSVHGDVDLIVKVLLTRDLISSDAEVISQFVHEQVRQLPGVISTNTLIPGLSKIKVPDVS